MKKPAIGVLVETILDKESMKEDTSENSEEMEEEEQGGERYAIAQDLIDAVKSEDAEGVVAALDATYEFWGSGSAMPYDDDDSDCGCK